MIQTIEAAPGVTKIAPDCTIKIKPINHFKTEPGPVPWHEAGHALVHTLRGKWVKEASRIPGPGYRGRTLVDEYDPVSFAAAHTMGCDGTGHDLAVIEYMGDDVGTAAITAGSILSNNKEKLRAVASLIEVHGAISGYDILWAIDKIDNPEAEVDIYGPKGKNQHFVKKTEKDKAYLIHVEIPDLIKDPEKSARRLYAFW